MKHIRILFLLLIVCSFGKYMFANDMAMLQTDRHCYISGDLVLFKIVIPNNNNEASVYVDLTNNEHQFIKGEILRLYEGSASGFLRVPDTLKTGNYVLRTYTYASKNALKGKFLCKTKIFITNRFGNNSELYKNDQTIIDSFTIQTKEIRVGPVDFVNDSLVYSTRSKVKINAFFTDELSEEFSGAIAVRPVSTCEVQSNDRNGLWWRSGALPNEFIQPASEINESKGIIVSGIAANKITGSPLSGLAVILSFQDTLLRLRYSITDSLGKFSFLLNDCYESEDIYLVGYTYPAMQLYENVEFSLDSKFILENREKGGNGKLIGYQHSVDSINLLKSIINKAYGIEYKNEKECKNNDNFSFEDEYLVGQLSKSTFIDDYIELPNFIEIAKEILPFTRIKDVGKDYVIELFDADNSIIRRNPLVFVDGVLLTNHDEIMEWGSSRIKQVDVRVKPRYYGDLAFERGIVQIWTKTMDFWTKAHSPNTHKFNIQCYQKQVTYSFPEYYKTSANKMPDFRQIVFWDPDIKFNDGEGYDVTFYTSDETGIFEVCLAGITNSGEPIYIRKYFEVK